MTDHAMTQKDWEDANFREMLRRLPRPLPCLSNGAVCPWCGELHQTVTFGENGCQHCNRGFMFGYPQWGSTLDHSPETYVDVPWAEFYALGQSAHHFPAVPVSDLLKEQHKHVDEMLAEAKGKTLPAMETIQ
jgi:hypothetical protein